MTPALRQRIITAAVDITAAEGWAGVTMSRLAEAVGVSRQTVYNEVGSKPVLAEAVVLDTLTRFLAAVDRAFDAHPDDVVGGVRAAVSDVLGMAGHDPLLRAIATATHGADTELLPLLTTRAEGLIDAASEVVRARLLGYDLSISRGQLDAVVDHVVRIVLSHVMQPGAAPRRTADDVAWAVSRMLA